MNRLMLRRCRLHWFPCMGLAYAAAFAVLVVVLSLASGCSTLTPDGASASGGGANYTLRRSDGGACDITVNSAREVGAAAITVDGDSCSMTADLDSLEAIPITPEMLQILLNR